MTADITTDTAVFVSGPLSGQRIGITPGARRQPNFRHDDGRPMPVRAGDREFIWRPLSGRPPRHSHILQSGYSGDAYIHASAWPSWQAANGDVRRATVQHYQSAASGQLVPQQARRADPVATSDEGRTEPRPRWDLAS